MILIQLDQKGIAVSGGSACTSGTHQPSHVLLELGRDRISALGSSEFHSEGKTLLKK